MSYQILPLAKQGSIVHVVCDDTDVFAHLVHFCDAEKIQKIHVLPRDAHATNQG